MNIPGEVKIKCKKCEKMVSQKDIVLDHFFKMMVCNQCVKDRISKEKQSAEDKLKAEQMAKLQVQAPDHGKPAGWDSDDEYLEKASKERDKNTVNVEKIDFERVKYTCPKCKYTFTYNVARKSPAGCPYCGTAIYRFKI